MGENEEPGRRSCPPPTPPYPSLLEQPFFSVYWAFSSVVFEKGSHHTFSTSPHQAPPQTNSVSTEVRRRRQQLFTGVHSDSWAPNHQVEQGPWKVLGSAPWGFRPAWLVVENLTFQVLGATVLTLQEDAEPITCRNCKPLRSITLNSTCRKAAAQAGSLGWQRATGHWAAGRPKPHPEQHAATLGSDTKTLSF